MNAPCMTMKYVEVEDGALEDYLTDEAWWVEQKMDGTRGLVHVSGSGCVWPTGPAPGDVLKHTAATQHLPVIEAELMSALPLMNDDLWVLDGEIMLETGEFRVFDLPYLRLSGTEVVTCDDPLAKRRLMLQATQRVVGELFRKVSVVSQARTEEDKRRLLGAVSLAGGEGVVFKHRDGAYQPGARVNQVRKHKFVKTADVVVTAVDRRRNEAGREMGSISFGVWDDGEVVPLGSCSVIGKPHVEPGWVIEVAYLYRAPNNGSLVQPRMTRVREDKSQEECGWEQFPAYTREVVW